MIKINFLFAILFALCASSVSAQWERKTYTVSVVQNARPFMWEEHGLAVGADPDFIREIGKRIGVNFIFKPMPMKRALHLLKEGEVDFGVGYKTESRAEYLTYLGGHPLHWAIYPLFVRRGAEFPFFGIEDLYGKKIGKNRSFSISSEFDKAIKERKIKAVEIEGYASMVKLLLSGRVDAIVGNPPGIVSSYNRMIHTEGIYPLERLISPLKGAYFAMSKNAKIKDREVLAEAISKAIDKIIEDGTVKEIDSRYSDFMYNPSINNFGAFHIDNTLFEEESSAVEEGSRVEGALD